MHKCNFYEDIVKLGWGHIKTNLDLYAALMPFINEILNLLTLTITKPYFKVILYPHHPHNFYEIVLKSFIDKLAITGILVNAAKYTLSHSIDVGIMKGCLYAFFTFFVPNVFMNDIISPFKGNLTKLIVGFIFIYSLDFCVNLINCKYIDWKIEREKSTGKAMKSKKEDH